MDREPKIKNCEDPRTKDKYVGEYKFNNVEFAYPTRPDSKILKQINFKIESNVKNAIVGESGGGKSTIMQMLLRFYDPDEGSILLDNEPLK